jgi:Bacterial extracellular solute-binding protein
MCSRLVVAVLLTASLALPLLVPPAVAQNALVVSVWGGNWKDTVEKVVGKAFTAKTGIPVEYEVGGTIDRLAKARVAKGSPLVDLNFTTTHVARLYISDGLYEKLDMAKLPNSKEIAKEAFRSDFHVGSWAYVYTVVYRPDLVKEDITKWSDLWKPSLKGKIAMPDFDPSHIITIAALMEGGNEVSWQKGEGRLKQLKESVAAFYSTDAQSQDLMKTGDPGQGRAADRLPGHRRHRHHGGHGGDQEVGRRAPVHRPGAVEGHPERAGEGLAGRPGQRGRHGARPAQGAAGHLPERGGVEGPRLHHERRGAGQEPAGLAGVVHGEHRQEVRRAGGAAP